MTGVNRTSRRRLAAGYGGLLVLLAVAVPLSLALGSDRSAEPAIAGVFRLTQASACLGDRGAQLALEQSGQYVTLSGPGDSGGSATLDESRLTGEVECRDGSAGQLVATVQHAGESNASLVGTVDGVPLSAALEGELETVEQEEKREGEETFGRLMVAIAVVLLTARLVGSALARLGQPRVMGEVLAGILLGPTLLGALAPAVEDYLFPADIVPLLSAAANIGLAFYMFLIGLEFDPRMLRGRIGQASFISNASVAVPLAVGMLAAVPLYERLGSGNFVAFALFLGVAMSITAFPVLARILTERRMLKRPLGVMALGAAAIDDVTAWGLLALASALAMSGSGLSAIRVVVLAALFCAAMLILGRRLLGRVSQAYDEAGHVPAGWITVIFIGVLLSAYTTQEIGVAAIFGAFVMGLIMPRRADLSHDVTRRIEDFVGTVLLPLFFVVTGLRTKLGLLDSAELWLTTLALLVLAVACKWAGAAGAATYVGLPRRQSAAMGALMNTRGLTELIVLNIGLGLGVITPVLFTMLVMMALVTTFMTAPSLRLIDPAGDLSTPPEEELQAVRPVDERAAPKRSLLVAPLDEKSTDSLVALAEPLARTEPSREVILADLLPPARMVPGLAAEERELGRATEKLQRLRGALIERGVAARALAFISADRGQDLVRLAGENEIDLILIDGRRPLLGEGVPRGEVGAVLERAPCDVAVLVESRSGELSVGPHHPILVPFGGAEHDWAALEIGAWLATAYDADLRLLGPRAQDGKRDASRLLANASLVVQQMTGIAVEPLLVEPGRTGVLRVAAGAGLLVVGLSERWRKEGLGEVRSEIAKATSAATLFVRRGTRPGALAPRADLTRFTWSRSGRA